MRQGSVTASQDDKNNPMNQAEELLTHLAKGAQDKHLRGKAFYDLGNIAYGRQDYGKAIELYKHALRCNPDDEQARHNLRLAQLKKQQQDKNKDQNQDQNKDNQDQNQDKQNQDKQNQDKQNQDKQQQQQGGMSQQNAEQVLKAMQDRERATQQRINAQQAQQQRHERRRTNRKW
jgi:tetratricopeptide (TPR) repeat protein